jgi:hypothetical protein
MIYEYNGKDWELTSMKDLPSQYAGVTAELNNSNPRYLRRGMGEAVYDSNGNQVGGPYFYDGEGSEPPDGVMTRRPDYTYIPAPTGQHYVYHGSEHRWVLESDAGTWIPPSDPDDWDLYDSSGNKILEYNSTDSQPAGWKVYPDYTKTISQPNTSNLIWVSQATEPNWYYDKSTGYYWRMEPNGTFDYGGCWNASRTMWIPELPPNGYSPPSSSPFGTA